GRGRRGKGQARRAGSDRRDQVARSPLVWPRPGAGPACVLVSPALRRGVGCAGVSGVRFIAPGDSRFPIEKGGKALKTARRKERRSFSKIDREWALTIPNLLEVQLKSFRDFLQLELDPLRRKNEGLQEVFTG